MGIESDQHGRNGGQTTNSREQAHQQEDAGRNLNDGGDDKIQIRHRDARADQDESETLGFDKVADADDDQWQCRNQAGADRDF